MAVAASPVPVYFPLGNRDPALPTHFWWGFSNFTGNLAGGTLEFEFLLTPVTGASLVRYSVEGVTLRKDNTTGLTARLQLRGFEELMGGVTPLWERDALLVVQIDRSIVGASARDEGLKMFPVRQRSGVALVFTISFGTNDNGINYECGCWGYRWGPRALEAGGPRRPF